MKQLLYYLIALTIALSPFESLSQEDFKFLPDDARIVESIYKLPNSHSPTVYTRYYEYYVLRDTLIDTLLYQLLGTRNKGVVQSIQNFEFNDTDFGVFAALRKDSSQVFFRLLAKVKDQTDSISHSHWNYEEINAFPLNEDVLIYDFNIENITSQSWSSSFTQVPTIDTIVTDNSLEKLRYMFYDGMNMKDPRGADFWIQDIGSSRGLLGNFQNKDWGYSHIPALAYFCSAELSYHYFSWDTFRDYIDCNFMATSIHKKNIEEIGAASLISLFPNPNRGQFSIKNELTKSIDRITVYNSIGQVIKSIGVAGQSDFVQTSENTYLVTINDKSPGLYFLFISFKEGSSVVKELVLK